MVGLFNSENKINIKKFKLIRLSEFKRINKIWVFKNVIIAKLYNYIVHNI